MRIAKTVTTWMIFLSLFFLAPMSFAQTGYILTDGSRAVIMERQLVLIGRDGKKAVARPGIYATKDGRYTIVVDGKGAVVQDRSKGLR